MKHSFKLSVVAFLLVLPVLVTAQYRKMSILELAGRADLIVTGKITELKPLSVVVEVKETLYGQAVGGKVEVNRFKGAKNAKRWGKYAEGEEVMLFLESSGSIHNIMGEGGEGEKFMMNGEVYLDGRGGAIFNRFNYTTLPSGANIYAEKLSAADFIAAIRSYREVYSVDMVDFTNRMGEVVKVPQARLNGDTASEDTYRALNDIAAKLVEDSHKAPVE